MCCRNRRWYFTTGVSSRPNKLPDTGFPMTLIDLFGYIAAMLTTTAFAPQALLTWKTRSVDGISLGMYSISG
jgi:hypothetical protein